MTIEFKTIDAEIKLAGEDGSFEAVIATFGVVDHDGDVIEHGAFAGHPIHVLPAHDQQHVPMGKAQIIERGNLAIAVGRFNMEIEAARDWHSALKFDLAEVQPAVQEWSWGFRIKSPDGARPDTVDGHPVRRLIALDEREVSPVVRAASIGTGTLSAKALSKADGMSDENRRQLLEQALGEIETDANHLWVEAVFSDVVVYNIHHDDKPSQTFERNYVLSGDAVTIADERREVVRDVSYRPVSKGDDDGMKMVDRIRLATWDVGNLVAEIRCVADGRKERSRKLGQDVSVEAIKLAGGFHQFEDVLKQLRDMADEMMPEDRVVQAASRFLASEARRVGVEL